MVRIPPGAPAPPAAAGWGRAGSQPGLGVGERDAPAGFASPHHLRPVNDIPEAGAQAGPGGSSAAHAPPSRSRPACQVPARRRQLRGRPGSPVRALAPPRPRGCPAPRPGVGGPRALLPPPSSPSHRLLRGEGGGCAGMGVAEGPTRSRDLPPRCSLRSG